MDTEAELYHLAQFAASAMAGLEVDHLCLEGHNFELMDVDGWESRASAWFLRLDRQQGLVDQFVDLERNGLRWLPSGGGCQDHVGSPETRSTLAEIAVSSTTAAIQFGTLRSQYRRNNYCALMLQCAQGVAALRISGRDDRPVKAHGNAVIAYDLAQPPEIVCLNSAGSTVFTGRLPH